MSNSTLLQEALLDAKVIKDVALKNAQETILEQFSPEVKKTLDKLLNEQIGEEDEDDELSEPDLSLKIPKSEEVDFQTNKDIPLAATERRKSLSLSGRR